MNQIFSEYNTLKVQECFLGEPKKNSLFKDKEIFSKKFAKMACKEMLPLTKNYLEFCLSNSLKQVDLIFFTKNQSPISTAQRDIWLATETLCSRKL